MSTKAPQLGFHLDGRVCRVGCPFCYLAQRHPAQAPAAGAGREAGRSARGGEAATSPERSLDPVLIADIVARLPRGDLAVAISEPAQRWRAGLRALTHAARARGVALSVTTTPAVVTSDPWVLEGAARVSLSLDPEKTAVPSGAGLVWPRRTREAAAAAPSSPAAAAAPSSPAAAAAPSSPAAAAAPSSPAAAAAPSSPAAAAAPSSPAAAPGLEGLDEALAVCQGLRRRGARLEIVGLVSVSSPEFAAALADDVLAALLERPELDAVALNALKPPPAWSDRAFWLRFCARLAPLLGRHLNRRLHLDCYVGARILGLGGCPAKPDISPGREFRACVYQAAPDFAFADADELAGHLRVYEAPATCPFEIR